MQLKQSDINSNPQLQVRVPQSKLISREKNTIQVVFQDDIQKGATLRLGNVRSKMCTHRELRKYAVFKTSVKRVLNYINYQIETSKPSSPATVPVSTWLESIDPDNDGSSQRSRGRQYWDERDTKSIEDAF